MLGGTAWATLEPDGHRSPHEIPHEHGAAVTSGTLLSAEGKPPPRSTSRRRVRLRFQKGPVHERLSAIARALDDAEGLDALELLAEDAVVKLDPRRRTLPETSADFAKLRERAQGSDALAYAQLAEAHRGLLYREALQPREARHALGRALRAREDHLHLRLAERRREAQSRGGRAPRTTDPDREEAFRSIARELETDARPGHLRPSLPKRCEPLARERGMKPESLARDFRRWRTRHGENPDRK